MDDDEHGCAVAGCRVVRVDHVELEVEGGSEEGRDLLREGRACRAEAQRREDERDEECEGGPERDGNGEKGAGTKEPELRRGLAMSASSRRERKRVFLPVAARPFPRGPFRERRPCRRRWHRGWRARPRCGSARGGSATEARRASRDRGGPGADTGWMCGRRARARGMKCGGCSATRCCCCCWGLAATRALARRGATR